jgi:glycerol kinase
LVCAAPPDEEGAVIAAIALDLGSTSIKAGLLRYDAVLSDVVAMPAPDVAVNGMRYESDALAYAQAAEQVLAQCLARTGDMPPLGLCSQRSSFLIWERASGQPVTPLISWQDSRGAASCEALCTQEPSIHKLSGLQLTPYYFAPKLRTLLLEHPLWLERLERGAYLVGTLDTFLIWRWSGGKQHVTDASMAARTLLMDVRQQCWSTELCKIFGIPLRGLAQIMPSLGAAIKLDNGLTVQACLADQSAAFFAGVGADDRAALVNLGTGGFVMRSLLQEQDAPDGYLRTLLYQDRELRAHVASEGTLNSIAAALADYPVEECGSADLATREIFCLAEPSGLGAPYFRKDFGVCFSQSVALLTQRQIACLLLEAIIFRVARILEELHRARPLERVYLSGGLSELECLQQGIAQCVPVAVYRMRQRDASLRGAALLAAGMHSARDAETEQVIAARRSSRLQKKYVQWKVWLDELLCSSAERG